MRTGMRPVRPEAIHLHTHEYTHEYSCVCICMYTRTNKHVRQQTSHCPSPPSLLVPAGAKCWQDELADRKTPNTPLPSPLAASCSVTVGCRVAVAGVRQSDETES